ncbi:MAG: DNA polymerase IV [Anaerovoracaceae bacterium]
MDRIILHCDMNAFYASCELLEHPELIDKPVAVCGNPNNRHGIILAKNEIAKQYGIVTAETLWQAKKKCPSLVSIPPHMEKYKEYSKKINEIYNRFTDMVEPFSIDESWLDVTNSQNLFGTGKEIADLIRTTVKNELGLTLSAGVSYNKIFAKMGSEYKKPDATTVITRENFKTLLWPLPVSELFFVGKATNNKLNKFGIFTIGDLANTNPKSLISLLGKQGQLLYDYSNGYDTSPVSLYSNREPIKSVGHGMTFSRNLVSIEDIKAGVIGLSDKVASRLRRHKLKAYGIKVDIKDPTFKVISRQKTLDYATNLTSDISREALSLIKTYWNISDPIRLLTVTAISLVDENQDEQINMFQNIGQSNDRAKNEKLERAIDSIRDKYGGNSISSGSIIASDIASWLKDNDKDSE